MAGIPLSRGVPARAMERDSPENAAEQLTRTVSAVALVFSEHRLFTNGANRQGLSAHETDSGCYGSETIPTERGLWKYADQYEGCRGRRIKLLRATFRSGRVDDP